MTDKSVSNIGEIILDDSQCIRQMDKYLHTQQKLFTDRKYNEELI